MAIFFDKIQEQKDYIENNILLTEDSKSIRTYKCPFCTFHGTKEQIVYHAAEEHEDMIPEGYTAARVVFNYFNKKDHGSCIICKMETKWNEDTWRYERLCDDKKCLEKYKKIVDARMIKRFGKAKILDDPEQQKKMLANRKISGTYKFKDGGIRSYVGSYEKKLLEFFDQVLHVLSKDILTPGPNIEYEYNGKILTWITDIMYIPFNLVMDVKDGEDNLNNRPMEDYRAKQVAKEKAIVELNKYNYIRLTNNNFTQLLLAMNQIKMQLLDYPDSDNKIININEEVGGPVIGMSPEIYLIPKMLNNTFVGTSISTDKYLNKIYTVDNDKLVPEGIDSLYDYSYSIYKYKGEDSKDKLDKIFKEDYINTWNCNKDIFYNILTGKDLLNIEQLSFDENFIEIDNPYDEKICKIRSISESIKYQYNELSNDNIIFDIIDEDMKQIRTNLIKPYDNIDIKQDLDGYFVYNEITKCRSKSYNNIEDIPEYSFGIIDTMSI